MPDLPMAATRLIRSLLRRRRAAVERLRFRAFTSRLRLLLRAHGARLVVDAPAGTRLGGRVRVELDPWGRPGDATFTLRAGEGARIGADVDLVLHAAGTNVLELGDRAALGDRVRLELRDGAIRLGPRTRVRSGVVLKSEGDLALGARVEVSWYAVMHCANRLRLDDFAGVAERVTIVDSDHPHDGSGAHFYEQPIRLGTVDVGRNAFLAAGCILTAGTVIGPNSVVAAGAVVPGGTFPEGSLVAGVPARVVRALAAGDQALSG